MDILDTIDKYIPKDTCTRERGIVIENDELIKGTIVDPNISKSNYLQVEGDMNDGHISITTNFDEKMVNVQPMPEDAWENMEHSIGEWARFKTLVESGMSSKDAVDTILMNSMTNKVKRGGKSTKKSKKKRKMSKTSRKLNRNK